MHATIARAPALALITVLGCGGAAVTAVPSSTGAVGASSASYVEPSPSDRFDFCAWGACVVLADGSVAIGGGPTRGAGPAFPAIRTSTPVLDFAGDGANVYVLADDGTIAEATIDPAPSAPPPTFRSVLRVPGAVRLAMPRGTVCGIDAAGDAHCAPGVLPTRIEALRALGPLREFVRNSYCAVLADDRLVCSANSPVAPAHVVLEGVRQAAMGPNSLLLESPIGAATGCAVLRTGEVRCWGSVSTATGDYASRQRPSVVAGLPPAREVAVSDRHACALTTRGEVYCWGATDVYQCGAEAWARPLNLRRCAVDEAATAAARAAAREANRQVCPPVGPREDDLCGRQHWGGRPADEHAVVYRRDSTCYVGDVERRITYTPVRVGAVHDALAVRVNEEQSCALVRGGRIVCWGEAQAAPYAIVLPPRAAMRARDMP